MSDTSSIDRSNEKVLLGHITGVHGLKGWVKVHSDTSPRENIVGFRCWWLEKAGTGEWIKVLDGRPQGKTIVAQLEGVGSPEQASLFTGATIAVRRSDMPALGQGEHYWSDLIGMQVYTVNGIEVGPVVRLFETGANDVMVVKDQRTHSASGSSAGSSAGNGKGSAREILVPWLVPDVITDVNTQENKISIDWDPDF